MEGGNFGYKGPKGSSWGRDQELVKGQTRQQAHWHQLWPGSPQPVPDLGVLLTELAAQVHAVWPGGPDYVLELVGASTVEDSLRIVRRGGTVCVAGSLSGWAIPEFEPIAMIPPGTRLTAFHSDSLKGSAGAAALQRVVREVEAGVYRPHVDRVFGLDDIVAAHRYMEANEATGKLVVVP